MDGEDNLNTNRSPLPSGLSFSFRKAFARHLRESLRHYGLIRTADELIAALYRLLRNRTPAYRRADFGDLDFDWEHLVDTTRSNVSFRTQLMATLAGHEYCPTEPWLFDQIMRALPIDFPEFTFIDLGSGKGRALLMASAYPFQRIIGVELLPELHRLAVDNIARYPEERKACRQIESRCIDAHDFQFPAAPTVLFLFNPFPPPVFVSVLNSLRHSLQTHPRPFFVAYHYPEYEHLLIGCEWLKKIAGTEQWVVYSYCSC